VIICESKNPPFFRVNDLKIVWWSDTVTFGFWHGAVWQVTNTTGGIFSPENLVYPYRTTRCHNTKDQSMNCSDIVIKPILALNFRMQDSQIYRSCQGLYKPISEELMQPTEKSRA
jgi:hypothetical protein